MLVGNRRLIMSDPSPPQTIPCPHCHTSIPFSSATLLAGEQIECPGCHSRIALARDDTDLTRDALKQFEALRRNASKIKPQD